MTSRSRFSTVKGTRDLLPPETRVWAAVEATARRVFETYGYGEIRTPILEDTELFVRGVGEATDIVGKEMYTFLDKKGRSLSLRPESTAPVARAFVEHHLSDWPAPVKLYYLGPQFRYERPQAGRYRQFYQIGAEAFGDDGPWIDVELLLMLRRFLGELGFEDLVVLLNTVGDRASRAAYGEALRRYLEPRRSELGEDSRRRLETNPLRILDTKLESETALLENAPALQEFLTPESREHFRVVCDALERFGVAFQVAERLVRGLDYYTRTVFEVVSAGLGAQNAILGGGRYDALISELGGSEVPGIGFAIGLDRLIDVLPESFRSRQAGARTIGVVRAGGVVVEEALRLAEELRIAGMATLVELGERSVKAALKSCSRRGCQLVVLLGEEELRSGTVAVKDLATGAQQSVARAELLRTIEER